MSSTPSRQLASRMTHRSRSVASSMTLIATAIAVGWFATEAILQRVGRPALLVAPDDLLAFLAEPSRWTLPLAAAAAVVGIILVVAGLTPARRRRRVLADERMTVIVDDAALAGAIQRTAADSAGLRRDRVRAALGRRTAYLTVTPTSGSPVDPAQTSAAVQHLLDTVQPTRRVRTRVAVDGRAVVGA